MQQQLSSSVTQKPECLDDRVALSPSLLLKFIMICDGKDGADVTGDSVAWCMTSAVVGFISLHRFVLFLFTTFVTPLLLPPPPFFKEMLLLLWSKTYEKKKNVYSQIIKSSTYKTGGPSTYLIL